MEVSPRAGGNRIAELQRKGTGVDLIEAEVLKAVGEPLPHAIGMPQYDGCYVNDIVHSLNAGIYQGITYDESFQKNHVISEAIYPSVGDHVEAFHGANNAIGSIFLRFSSREELNEILPFMSEKVKPIIKPQ